MTTEQRDHGLPAKPSQFEKNSDLDTLLVRINDYLRQAEQSQPEPPAPEYPLILLVGAPRSGTTLFMQWLCSTRHVAVPTNLISRFFSAPAFGVMLQRLLSDRRYRYRDEFDDLPTEPLQAFGSDLGKTKGILGHNSFFYFWRQFFPLAEPAPIPDNDLHRVDGKGLVRAIGRFANEVEAPLAMKGYLVQYHLGLLEKLLDRVLFVHIIRDPLDTMRSLLEVRKSLYGDEGKWWGCRPPGCDIFMGQAPAIQVAGQIALTQRSIRSELARMPDAKHIEISYELLCDSPAQVWSELRNKISAQTVNGEKAKAMMAAEYHGPQNFRRSRQTPKSNDLLFSEWTIANEICRDQEVNH